MRVRGCLVAALLSCAAPALATEYAWIRSGEAGRMLCAGAPPNWRDATLDDSAWQPRDTTPDAGTGCSGTTFVRWRFDVGAELSKLQTVTLRLRYGHGFAAYLNGTEIARRNLDPGADAAALATEPHGPEAERMILPVKTGLIKAAGNLLAIEVHPRTLLKQPFVDVELSGADGVRIVRGPYLRQLSEHDVILVFDTDLPAMGEARWGTTPDYGETVSDPAATIHHVLRLPNLKPGPAYHYTVSVRRPSGPLASASESGVPLIEVVESGDATFRTLPRAGKPLRVAVYGDVRSGHEVHAMLNQKLIEEDADLAILTGDLVDRGSDQGDWEKFFEVAGPLLRQLAIFPAPGNHEYARLGRGAAAFMALFRWPIPVGEDDTGFYSFDAAGVHFVALDSNQYRSPAQLAWLDKDLARARKKNARAVFVYAHEPPYSTGLHGDNAVCIRDIVPILERHKVSMFFGGHDHHYERGKKGALDYIVTGGGGAELRIPRCGAPGKRACPPHVAAFSNDHHYVMLEVMPSFFRVCPKRVDGTAIEACITYPLKK
jgi:acid phosphatase type 7